MKEMLKKALYIGLTGFGGPAILGFMKKEFVEKEKSLSEDEFYEGLGLAQMLPGATGVNLITYIAYRRFNFITAFLAQFLFILPSVISMLLLSMLFFKFGNVGIVKEIFKNINIAVVVLFVATIEKIVFPLMKKRFYAVVMISVAVLRLTLKVNIFLLVAGAIILAVIFDKSLPPDKKSCRRVTSPAKPIAVFIIFIALFITSFFFEKYLFAEIFFNMTKTGFTVFGGGTAAIPMIHDMLVENLRWLTNNEFLTGISIAQLTPGPVLNISTFTGYKLGGLAGSFFATVGMFFPGFILMVLLSNFSDFILTKPFFRKFSVGILLGFTALLICVFYMFIGQTLVDIKSIVMFIILLGLQYKFKLGPLWIIGITVAATICLSFFHI